MASSALGSTGLIASLPAGSLVDFAGSAAPTGWLMCDGSAQSRTVYASLFAAIGTTYGAGDGSTTFNLPDFRGRFARYMDNMGTSAGAAGRDSGRVLGSSQTQTTAKNGLANSSSNVSASGSAASGGGHSHNLTTKLGFNYSSGSQITMVRPDFTGVALPDYTMATATSGSHTHSVSVSGTSEAQTITGDAETRPINLSCHRIIKY